MGIREDPCILYQTPVTDLLNLKVRTRQAFVEVKNIMRDNTWRELASRLQMLQNNGGSQYEVC